MNCPEEESVAPWRETQFLDRLIRRPGSPRRRRGSGALEEKRVWGSQGGRENFFFALFSHITKYLAQGHVSP